MIQETSGPAQATKTVSRRCLMIADLCPALPARPKDSSNYIHFIFVLWDSTMLDIVVSCHIVTYPNRKGLGSCLPPFENFADYDYERETVNAFVSSRKVDLYRHSSFRNAMGMEMQFEGASWKANHLQPNWNIHWNFCIYRACPAFGIFWEGHRRSSPGSVWCHLRERWKSVLRVWWTDSQVCSKHWPWKVKLPWTADKVMIGNQGVFPAVWHPFSSLEINLSLLRSSLCMIKLGPSPWFWQTICTLSHTLHGISS